MVTIQREAAFTPRAGNLIKHVARIIAPRADLPSAYASIAANEFVTFFFIL
jgi:hypothetical protein